MVINWNEKLYCIVLLGGSKRTTPCDFEEPGILCSVKSYRDVLYIDDIIDNSKIEDKMKRREITFSKAPQCKGSRFYIGLSVIEPSIPLETLKYIIEKGTEEELNNNHIDIAYAIAGYGLRFFSAPDDESAKLIYQLNLF